MLCTSSTERKTRLQVLVLEVERVGRRDVALPAPLLDVVPHAEVVPLELALGEDPGERVAVAVERGVEHVRGGEPAAPPARDDGAGRVPELVRADHRLLQLPELAVADVGEPLLQALGAVRAVQVVELADDGKRGQAKVPHLAVRADDLRRPPARARQVPAREDLLGLLVLGLGLLREDVVALLEEAVLQVPQRRLQVPDVALRLGVSGLEGEPRHPHDPQVLGVGEALVAAQAPQQQVPDLERGLQGVQHRLRAQHAARVVLVQVDVPQILAGAQALVHLARQDALPQELELLGRLALHDVLRARKHHLAEEAEEVEVPHHAYHDDGEDPVLLRPVHGELDAGEPHERLEEVDPARANV